MRVVNAIKSQAFKQYLQGTLSQSVPLIFTPMILFNFMNRTLDFFCNEEHPGLCDLSVNNTEINFNEILKNDFQKMTNRMSLLMPLILLSTFTFSYFVTYKIMRQKGMLDDRHPPSEVVSENKSVASFFKRVRNFCLPRQSDIINFFLMGFIACLGLGLGAYFFANITKLNLIKETNEYKDYLNASSIASFQVLGDKLGDNAFLASGLVGVSLFIATTAFVYLLTSYIYSNMDSGSTADERKNLLAENHDRMFQL